MPERKEEIMEIVMTLIMHGGDARSSSMEAIHAAKNNDYVEAQKKLDGADESLKEAHEVQNDLLAQEASGDNVEINLLLIHAEDHLMSAMTYRDLAEEMIDLYKRVN